jgi:8-oxo-dGTP diphosphatase
MPDLDIVVAAGAVVLRGQGSTDGKGGRREVLLVHRPKYDDWTLPKGKLDAGESVRAAAVREVEEETGVPVRLGPPLSDQVYPVTAGVKLVHWWVGHPAGEHDVSAYAPNAEIGDVRWVPADRAPDRLTYDRDRETLAQALTYPRTTMPFVVLRHAAARDKKKWDGHDNERPLTEFGQLQAEAVAPDLAAYHPDRVVSSAARRCWTTLAPYAEAAGTDIEVTDDLSQADGDEKKARAEMQRLVDADEPLVVCSHRPVLPWMFEALDLEPAVLRPAGMAVLHHRAGRVAAVERIAPPNLPA